MTKFEVIMVSAFGRGETLAMALEAAGLSVRVLDFSEAFPSEYRRGPGPFPIGLTKYLPEQGEWLSEATPLNRGLAFWLEDGPLELSGPMAPFYSSTRQDVKVLHGGDHKGDAGSEFKTDWLRRFLVQWAAPVQRDSWSNGGDSIFPWKGELGLIPSYDETQVLSFDRLRASNPQSVVACKSIQDIHIEAQRLQEIEVEASGKDMAFSAPQWAWCLSSRETEILNSELASEIFPKGVWRPEWSWVSFDVTCEHGPWTEGLPVHTILIGDICLPWVYSNMAVLRRLDPEGFSVWIKVPAKSVDDETMRSSWCRDLAALMNARLSLAKWSVDSNQWGICPHSPVFDVYHAESGLPSWKNWDWLAPERLPRLDFSARLEAEAQCFQRLMNWRSDQMKKQGAQSRDSALHTP